MGPSDYQKSVFDGLMLSDIGLRKDSKNASITMTCKHRSFMDAMIERLFFLSWGPVTEKEVYDKRTEKSYHSCKVSSHVSEWLTAQYSRWYCDGVKIVPEDIIIDKDVLEWWYIGDGHLERKKARPNYRRIIMATDSFVEIEKDILCEKLRIFLDRNAVYKEGKKIAISKKALVKMAKMLTVCPVVDYSYKYEFGHYRDENYFTKTYKGRPLELINKYRQKHKVKDVNYEEIKGDAI